MLRLASTCQELLFKRLHLQVFLSYQDLLVFLFSSNLSLTVKGKNKIGKSTPLEVPGLPHFPRENYKSLRPRITVVTAA